MTDWIDHERTRMNEDAARYWPDAPIPDCELAARQRREDRRRFRNEIAEGFDTIARTIVILGLLILAWCAWRTFF